MLGTNLMKSTNNRPLKERERTFYGVGVNISAHPFFFGVIHGLVGSVMVSNSTIGGQFVGDNGLGCGFCMLSNEAVEGFSGSPVTYVKGGEKLGQRGGGKIDHSR